MSAPETVEGEPTEGPSRGLIVFIALACGLSVADLYYAQPLAGPISRALSMPTWQAGLVVTLTQIGYGAGLIFLVPLGDLVENRRLIAVTALGGALSLVAAAFAPNAPLFLASAFLVGFGAVAAQMLVPLAAHLTPARMRGRVVGEVMSGLLAGILLARPVASLLADRLGWRGSFLVPSGFMVALAAVSLRVLPQRRPDAGRHYGALLASLMGLWRETPVLRRCAFRQGCMFCAFSLFWTTAPLLLESPAYRLSQSWIAAFALAGAGGALIAPVAGRLADRGLSAPASLAAYALAAFAFLLGVAGRGGGALGLCALTASGVLLDLGVQLSQVINQREIYTLAAHARSRLNGLYIASYFVGGAVGSGVGGVLWATAGWLGVSGLGVGLAVLAFAGFVWSQLSDRARAAT